MRPVAYEFLHPNGHAIVDYSERTHAGHLTAEKGYTAKPLVYAEHAMEALAALRTICADPWAYRSELGVKKLAEIAAKLAGNAGVRAGVAPQPTADECNAANRLLDRLMLEAHGTTVWPANWMAVREQLIAAIRTCGVRVPEGGQQ